MKYKWSGKLLLEDQRILDEIVQYAKTEKECWTVVDKLDVEAYGRMAERIKEHVTFVKEAE